MNTIYMWIIKIVKHLNFTGKIDLRTKDKYIALSNITISIHGKI